MRNTKNTIKMFATSNPTDKFIVAIDGFFCYVDTEAEAEKIYNLAMPGSDGYIDNTTWGSIDIIPPHHYPKYINGYQPEGGIVDVTTRTPIDLVNYINKADARFTARMHSRKDILATTTAKQRLTDAKEDLMILLGKSL